MRYTTILSTRHQRVATWSNWPANDWMNCKDLPSCNRSMSQRFQQSICSPSSCSAFDPTLLSTRFACARACLAAQFAFFSRADSGVLLTAINAQVSNTTLPINQSAKNVAHNQAAPSSRVSSAQDDPDNSFIKLQLRWKMLRNHRDTDLYWFCDDDPVSLSKNSGIITEWLLLLLVEPDIPTLPGVKWTGHSLRRGGASAAHAIGVSIAVIMAWGLWKSLASALFYIDDRASLSKNLGIITEWL